MSSSCLIISKLFFRIYDRLYFRDSKHTISSFESEAHLYEWYVIGLCLFLKCQFVYWVIKDHTLINWKYTYAPIYFNSHNSKLITEWFVIFHKILHHHKFWTKTLQLYCVMEYLVPNYLNPPNKYNKTWMTSTIDNIYCMDCTINYTHMNVYAQISGWKLSNQEPHSYYLKIHLCPHIFQLP